MYELMLLLPIHDWFMFLFMLLPVILAFWAGYIFRWAKDLRVIKHDVKTIMCRSCHEDHKSEFIKRLPSLDDCCKIIPYPEDANESAFFCAGLVEMRKFIVSKMKCL